MFCIEIRKINCDYIEKHVINTPLKESNMLLIKSCKKSKIHFFVVIFLTSVFSFSAIAQNKIKEDNLESVIELRKIMKTKEKIEGLFKLLAGIEANNFSKHWPDLPNEAKYIYQGIFIAEGNKETIALEKDYIAHWKSIFSKDEIQQLITILTSPVILKFNAVQKEEKAKNKRTLTAAHARVKKRSIERMRELGYGM